MKKKISNFSWPNDDVFQEWKDKYVEQKEEIPKQLEDVAAGQQVEEVVDTEKDLQLFLGENCDL